MVEQVISFGEFRRHGLDGGPDRPRLRTAVLRLRLLTTLARLVRLICLIRLARLVLLARLVPLARRRRAIVRHHQRSARIFLGWLLSLWQCRRGAPGLRSMTGINLTRIGWEAGIERRWLIIGRRPWN
jgi:hypothetical protein